MTSSRRDANGQWTLVLGATTGDPLPPISTNIMVHVTCPHRSKKASHSAIPQVSPFPRLTIGAGTLS
jgi:hypothetical protein